MTLKAQTTKEKIDNWVTSKFLNSGTSLAVQWLGPHASTAAGSGSIPGWGTKILYAAWRSQKKFFILYVKDTINRVKRQPTQASRRFQLGKTGNFQDKSRE